MRTRISGWNTKLLSLGGKEVLIKSIAQSIPTFAMMVFKIPKNVCKGITDTISQFWWGDDNENRKMVEAMYPKTEGWYGVQRYGVF